MKEPNVQSMKNDSYQQYKDGLITLVEYNEQLSRINNGPGYGKEDNMKILPCPFCGEVPKLPEGIGTQYEIECDCGMAMSSIQISDLMTIEERQADDFSNHRYSDEYVERAKSEAIKNWNNRHL